MQRIKRVFILLFVAVTLGWLIAEPGVFTATGLFPIRSLVVQYSGLLAIVAMSVAMVLAVRPVALEPWFGGLDKMYRLHKWLGIGALVVSVIHWLAVNGPRWAVGWGLIERPQRGPRPAPDNAIAEALMSLRGPAEFVGEWTFYLAALLITLALVKWFPYRLFYKTHRILAAAYLVLVFHTVVLTKFSYWLTPVGLLLAPLLIVGTWAAVLSLTRRIGNARQVEGSIKALEYYPGVKALEAEIDVPAGWNGHKPGQFAFVTSDASEGAHPYTIASAWDDAKRNITFIVKGLGDHTNRLREKLRVGQTVKIEGPYGCFTFDDGASQQIWIGGGIGITPFIARMKQMAGDAALKPRTIHLFHPSADYDEVAFAKLAADADAAGINVHVTVDSRDGLLDAERIRKAVPGWRDASIWFCGPIGLGKALRTDFTAAGMDVEQRFHQELFAMR